MDVLSDVISAMRVGKPHSSRTCKRAPWGMRFDAFDGAGFHVVLQGSCWLFPSVGDPVALGVGDVVFLPRAGVHGMADSRTTSLADTSARSLPDFEAEPTPDRPGAPTLLLCGAYLLDQGRMHPLLAELPEVVHLPARVGSHPSLRAALDLLGNELEEPRQGTGAVVPALLDMLLLYILRAWLDEQTGHAHTGWAAALGDPAIAAALRSIHREPERQWTVETLGALAGLSRAAFARRFATLLGHAPVAYLTWWRMTMAARLLQESDAPLGTVATRVGYTSQFAFAKAFKREFGVAPGGYRRSGTHPGNSEPCE
ncbi:AraC family transcriptional regulator [Amycolatopsis endophytica]|uniref:AraC-like DNA-binding protein n=1 Tax=Amycolatopsis endophytica TaxID=860233 RepID=A0A853B5D7_9PSEU|nr:AraC family transcriptional regulator [Amycolatopsis endophytica]NYI90428.1 AraC-like DNA-binding protein [Amycolatopsis endophytica]